jgi:hypothetical protein
LSYIQLTYGDLVLPALLVLMNGVLSIALHLRLERNLLVATVRMCIQLILVGYVLTFLFAAVSLFWTAVAALTMILFASREVTARQKRQLSGLWSYGLGAGPSSDLRFEKPPPLRSCYRSEVDVQDARQRAMAAAIRAAHPRQSARIPTGFYVTSRP